MVTWLDLTEATEDACGAAYFPGSVVIAPCHVFYDEDADTAYTMYDNVTTYDAELTLDQYTPEEL